MYPRPIHLVASLMLCCCAGLTAGDAAAAPADELSPAAKRAISTAEDSIARARAVFQTASAKEQEKLVAALLKEQETQTKAGKLEAALAVKALVEKVKSGEYLKELEQRSAESDDLLGDKAAGPSPQLARLAGYWHMAFTNDWRRMVSVDANGKVSIIRSNNAPQGSTYNLRWDAKGKCFVSEGLGGMLEVYRVDGERLTCEHWCDGSKYPAEPFSFTAVVERMREPPPAQGQPVPVPQPGRDRGREIR